MVNTLDLLALRLSNPGCSDMLSLLMTGALPDADDCELPGSVNASEYGGFK